MKSTITLLFSLIFGFQLAFSQPLNRATPKVMLETARAQLEKQDPYQALVWFEQYYEETKDRAVAREMAYLQLELRDYSKSARQFARYLDRGRDKENQFVDDRFDYGRVLKMNGKFDEAIAELEQFILEGSDPDKKELAKNEIAGAKLAIQWELEEDDGKEVNDLKIENVKKLNSKYSEYGPVMHDGELYFAGFGEVEEVIEISGTGEAPYVQIFKSSKNNKDRWKDGEVLDVKINREDYQTSSPTFSSDGEFMYFTRALLKGNNVELSQIHYSPRRGGSWGAPNEVVIGSDGQEFKAFHPSVGELFAKEVLFFVSDMDGGFGGLDIYYITKKGEGVYTDPINLGPRVNTPGDEVTPYYRDGTLYFASNGWPTLGGFDLFITIWDGRRWSDPENMGKGFNTALDETAFTLDKDGLNGFFVSNRRGTRSLKSRTCCDDIYTINIPPVTADLLASPTRYPKPALSLRSFSVSSSSFFNFKV
jgi:peptidoglycan-associated lipoprotein